VTDGVVARVDISKRPDDHQAHTRFRQEDRMRALSITTNLRVADVEATRSFYTDYLGLSTEEFNMGWVARYTSPDGRAKILRRFFVRAPDGNVINIVWHRD
jgi:hypothetical protein